MQMQHTSCFHLVWLALIAVTLAGCETMSKDECRSADWAQVGYQDGREGRARSRIESITESCTKTNVAPDRERYFIGRNKGLREYCTPAHGFELGKNGAIYSRVCPPESANGFEASYKNGHRIYDASQVVSKLEDKRHKLEDRLSKANTDKERKSLRDDLEVVDRGLRSARDMLETIENETRNLYR